MRSKPLPQRARGGSVPNGDQAGRLPLRCLILSEPYIRLRQLLADRDDEQRRQPRDQEARAPADRRREESPDHGRERDADRRACLHVRAIPPPDLRRKRFSDVRLPGRPLSPDPETRHDAAQQKHGEVRREPARERARTEHEDRPLQGRLSPDAIGEKAEENAPDGGRGERRPEDRGDLDSGEPKLLAEGDQEEAVEDEVVEVEHPARPRHREDFVVRPAEFLGLIQEAGRDGRGCRHKRF